MKTKTQPLHIYLSSSGKNGKSYVVKKIYQAVRKTLFYYSHKPEKPRVLLLGHGTTIHSAQLL